MWRYLGKLLSLTSLIAVCFAPGWSYAVREDGVFQTEEHQNGTLHLIGQEYPWASVLELEQVGGCVARRVGVGKFEIDVENIIGSGKSGIALLVTVVEPASRKGETAVLKMQNGANALESISDEAAFMKKVDGVPHASQLMDTGKLWIPNGMFGKVLPIYGPVGLLMTAAPGKELKEAVPLDEEAMAKVKADLEVFSDAMASRHLFHGDLTLENVFWDGTTATVIDFGNGQDLNEEPKRRQDFMARKRFKDAKYEMGVFYTEKLDKAK